MNFIEDLFVDVPRSHSNPGTSPTRHSDIVLNVHDMWDVPVGMRGKKKKSAYPQFAQFSHGLSLVSILLGKYVN